MANSINIAASVPFQAHPEVWLLVGFLVVAYVFMVRTIGPRAVAPGEPVVTSVNVGTFVVAMALLWVSSDWPVHDIAEDHLYFMHMVQHMSLTYFLPPLALMATPPWLARVLLGEGLTYKIVKWFAQPVVAGVIFNASIMVLHIPLLVNESVESGPLHYLLHVLVVFTALLMWLPVCGPVSEFRMGAAGAMIYLFAQSLVPTVPAAWLTFAEQPVYQAYDHADRLWGVGVIDDQQLAGGIMKVAGGLYLWAIVIYLFFKKFAAGNEESYDYRRPGKIPTAEITGNDEAKLTTADVERVFAETVPPSEP